MSSGHINTVCETRNLCFANAKLRYCSNDSLAQALLEVNKKSPP